MQHMFYRISVFRASFTLPFVSNFAFSMTIFYSRANVDLSSLLWLIKLLVTIHEKLLYWVERLGKLLISPFLLLIKIFSLSFVNVWFKKKKKTLNKKSLIRLFNMYFLTLKSNAKFLFPLPCLGFFFHPYWKIDRFSILIWILWSQINISTFLFW